MNNTIQLYIDDDKEIKGYPLTSPDRVVDENGKSVQQEIKKINGQLDEKANKRDIAKISSGTPLFVDSVEDMFDNTKNYVNTTDGYLYTYINGRFVNSSVKYLENGLSDGQVSRVQLSNYLCGRDFEINQTKAYPGINFVVNNAQKGKNITLKFKIIAKNIKASMQMKYMYGGSYQHKDLTKPQQGVEQEYAHTWENTTDRTVTGFNIQVNNNNQNTVFNAIIKEVRLFIDGREHSDFIIKSDNADGITDLTEYNYVLASREFVKESVKDLGITTVAKLDTGVFGKKYEIKGFTQAMPRLQLIKFKQQYKNASIEFSFKITPKNNITFFNVITNGWQSRGYYTNNIKAKQTTLIEGTISENNEFDGMGLYISDNNPASSLDGIYEDLIVKINGEIVDFDLTTESVVDVPDREIVDITEEYKLIASKLFVEKQLTNIQETLTSSMGNLSETTVESIREMRGELDSSLQDIHNKVNDKINNIHYSSLSEDIVGNCFYVHKVSAYPGMVFNFNLKILKGQRVQLIYKAKVVDGNTGHYCSINYKDGSYNDLTCKATEKGKLQEVKSNIIEFSNDKNIFKVKIAKNNNNPATICHQFIYDPCLIIDGVRYPLTENMIADDSNALILKAIKEEFPVLASKKFVEDAINEAVNGAEKKEFILPFVNNLYVVQGSERKHSVPIFIDYLYNGSKDKILFENGEDRAYIREAVLSPNTQSANIVNTKETLKFKSETLTVPDVKFNKVSIEEKTPNGVIRLLIIGDSVTAGAITEKQYWAIARELFALEDIDKQRNSDIMFLGSNNVKKETIDYKGTTKEIKSCACGISSWSLNEWLTNSASHFVYDNNGKPEFSILKWIERYRTHLDDGTKLELGNSNLGSAINSNNIDNIQCCTPNIVYINSTHNGGTIEEHEKLIEIIRREIPDCKIIVGNPMPLIGTWHKEKYVGKEWLDDASIITGPNYNWGGAYGTSRIESLKYYMQKERDNDWFHFMPQVVTMPTVEALEYELVDCGVKQMKQVTKVNQLPREHPGTITHKIWGYELYALLKYISGMQQQGVTNNFNTVPLFD